MQCEIECILVGYFILLCIGLGVLWVYELVCIRRDQASVVQWYACEYCGTLSTHKNLQTRCPACHLYPSL